jgi:hypothetical protein
MTSPLQTAVAFAFALTLAACGGGTEESADTAQEAAAADADDAPAAMMQSASIGTPTRRTSGSIASAPGASQIVFSGHTFQVRSGGGGPGPNNWSAQNVWVDASGFLHLKISNNAGTWSSAEIYTTESLGFGTYQFKLIGHPETFDKNVVLGLFNYTTPSVGPDGTNEIDIEFATWGGAQPQHGNWTVWPAAAGPAPTSQAFDPLPGTGLGTYRFDWTSQQVAYQALTGHTNNNRGLYSSWTFAPADFSTRVPQNPVPLHMNFWLFQGSAPSDGLETEIVVSEFKFTPARRKR